MLEGCVVTPRSKSGETLGSLKLRAGCIKSSGVLFWSLEADIYVGTEATLYTSEVWLLLWWLVRCVNPDYNINTLTD